MKDLRAWVAILAVACLAAGAGGGVLYARATTPHEAAARSGAFAEYETLLVRTFELSTARHDALRAVLASYEADLARIKDRHMADYMNSIEPELRERGRFYRELVRDRVLPEARRAEFDAMSLGTPVTSTP